MRCSHSRHHRGNAMFYKTISTFTDISGDQATLTAAEIPTMSGSNSSALENEWALTEKKT